jgi:hypothetical protein
MNGKHRSVREESSICVSVVIVVVVVVVVARLLHHQSIHPIAHFFFPSIQTFMLSPLIMPQLVFCALQ